MREGFCVAFLSLLFSWTCFAQSSSSYQYLSILAPDDSSQWQVLQDPDLYLEYCDTLAHMRFWRRIMRLSPDSSILNIAHTRQMLHAFPTAAYDTLARSAQKAFKDSLRKELGLSGDLPLYITYGKNHFYQFLPVIPQIDAGIRHFQQVGTDPWFAQAILLIESPAISRRSPDGANGAFQLMRQVAIRQGLKINSQVDEREDFGKAAEAAASFIGQVCIPETEKILRDWRIPYARKTLWFRLLTLHVYHAGAGNVRSALRVIKPRAGGMGLIRQLWKTRSRGFGNASQNYSQVALASLLELDYQLAQSARFVCLPE